MSGVIGPDQRAFQADVAKAAFRLGEVEGRWRIVMIAWPFAFVAVVAKDGREFVLRLNCSGYPQQPPTGGPWDIERDQVLAFGDWPQGKGGRVSAVFRTDWKGGTALYLPCDRESIKGHDVWRQQMPSKVWRPSDGIVHYLEQVYELLHCRDYAALVCAEA